MRRYLAGARVVRLARLGASILALLVAAVLPSQAAAAVSPRMAVVHDSVSSTSDVDTGAYHSGSMSIEVVLAPTHQAQLKSVLAALYDAKSGSYQHWLTKGQFAASFGPSGAERAAVVRYLASEGLTLKPSTSPFLVRATGSSALVSGAFRTNLRTFRDARGISYFSNVSAVQLPASVAGGVLGVVGLTNTVRPESNVARIPNNVQRGMGKPTGSSSCETPYPTRADFYNAVNNGVSFPFGYGAGPGCSGLTPSQDNSIYDAPNGGPRVQGAGVNAAVFELSAYQESDIDTWAHQFYGKHYTPPLVNINVDGGPLNPVCPAGDTCPPAYNGYAGDIEVDADIEMILATAPDIRHLEVYNAPNDYTGQTELDEYSAIAQQDTADTVSSSWSECENDVDAAYVQAENVVFEQMAAQGQSMFGAAGDTGAFECIRSDGTTIVNSLDPPSQPYVTSVGGTSLTSFNPGQNPNPSYPRNGAETIWNVDGLCNSSANEGGQSGFFWCAETGAGGGGFSQYWGRPSYQRGPGVNSRYTTYANGSTQCALAAAGTPCREVPDVSMNADEYTPYSEYCTGNASTPNSVCATISTTPAGWFGIGGTSLSSPFTSAIIADRDGFDGRRTGLADELFYSLFNSRDPGQYFHDITGAGQFPNNNGLFPTTPNYDEATGIGSLVMAGIITGR
ncbi:MAG TPA: S53 family serine peptidase [Solirubrobacteraceae bacterium]|nr:S53 family serine peptidase [Solirubrobacteraceae bacterium]